MIYDIEEIRSIYKDLFEYSLDLIFVNKLNGDFLNANDNLLKTFGLKREDISQYSLSDIMDKDQLTKAYNALTDLKKTGRQSNMMEFRINGKDGITIYVDAYVIPLYKNDKIYATLGIARNITDLRKTQNRLERSEEKYRFLYETTPYSIILLNSEGIIVDCNPTTELMFGYIKDELVGRHFKNISAIHQKYIPILIELFPKHIEGEMVDPIDIQIYHKNGKLMWVNTQASIINLSGNLFVQVIFHDITDKKVISQKLEESRNLYRTLVTTSPDAIIVTDLKGKIIEVSEKVIALSGGNSIEDVIGKSAFDLISPQDIPRAIENHQRALKGQSPIKAEYTINRLDGAQFIGELNTSLINDKDGKAKAFIGIMRDITEQKNAEKLLKESEEQYRDLYQNALVSLWTVRIQDAKIIRANKVSTELTGVKSLEELTTNYYAPEFFEADVIRDIYKKLKISGEISGVETQFKDVMGNEKTLSFWAKLYSDKGIIEGAFLDISNLKIVQKALQESEQKYRHLFDNSPNMITLLDSDGKILDVNSPFLKIFNFKEDDIIGKSYRQLENIPLKNLTIYKEKFKNIFTEGTIEPFELQVEVKGDLFRWMNIQGSIIDIEGKKLLQVIFQDINERKEAEQKLKESEERYRIISENANDLITVINEKFRFEYINEEVHKRVTGYLKEDLIGKSPLNNIHPEDVKKTVKTWRDAVISGEGRTEFRYKKKDGTWIWLDMRGKKFIDTNGEPKGILISRDITKHKLAEQKLKESEEKYRHLFENSPYSIGLLELDGTLIESNEATNKFLSSRTNDDIIGKNIREIFSSTEQDKSLLPVLTDYIKDVIKDEKREPLEIPITRSIGDVLWISFNGSLVKIGDKTFLQFLGQDITDRKRVEQNLKKSEEQFRRLFENSPNAIILNNQEGIIVDCNSATERIFGVNKNQLIGVNYMATQGRSASHTFSKRYGDLLKNKELKPTEFQLIRRDGTPVWINYQSSVIKLGDETLIQSILQDISKRKLAEENLIKSEEKYRLLFEKSPNAIILSNSKGTILDFNTVTEKLLGYKRDKTIGANYAKITSPSHIALMKKRYKNHLKGIPLKPLEFEAEKRDGSKIWVNFQNEVIKFGEEDISISIIQDITKRKEAELLINEELIKLKELEQIRKDLISRVSHELKTPLIPVISGTELLTTIYKDQIGEDALEIIDMIDKGGARLKDLVEKLINVSRIEYNKFDVRKETFNLSEIIKRSANSMKFLLKQRMLKLKCEIPEKLSLEMDELRIEEVIMNLLSNAIKNTTPHGEINLSLRKEDNWAILTVNDTGVGLTEKEKEVLFTRFGKIERYERGLEDIDVKGSGLGLYICKEIIQLHGGQIWAESEGRNKGSSFTVKLPIK